MPDIASLKLYLFEGVPTFTDLRREGDLMRSDSWVYLRTARRDWRNRHAGRDPRYLVYVEGVALASDSMQPCPHCGNERPRVCEAVVCFCTLNS